MNWKKVGLFLALLPVAALMAMTLTYTGAMGGDVIWWRAVIGAIVSIGMLVCVFALPLKRALLVSAVLIGLTFVYWAVHFPSNDRDWAPAASKTAWAEVDGTKVTFHNVRNFRYAEDGTFKEDWYTATYDANDMEQGYFSITTFGGVPGLAHVMVSFKFKGEQYLMMSVEIRREKGEEYHPIGGFFRQFELFYVVADERDALALRTHIHKDPTWLIPMNAGPEKTGEFFLDMVRKANELHENAEWYNSITSSCASNLAEHYEIINDVKIPPDYRIILPGFSGEVLEELDLLPEGMSVDEALKKFRVDERARELPLDEFFSTRIREYP